MASETWELQWAIGHRAIGANGYAVALAGDMASRVDTGQREVHLTIEHVLHAEGVEIGILVGTKCTVVAEMEVAATPLEGVLTMVVGPAVVALVNVLRSTERDTCE